MISFRKDRQCGYTVAEMLVVVAIIGVLAAISVPSYFSFRKKAVATEARANLNHLYKLEIAYKGEHGSYTTILDDIGFILTDDLTYSYEVLGAWPTGFSAGATANLDRDPHLDFWTIDQTGILHHMVVD